MLLPCLGEAFTVTAALLSPLTALEHLALVVSDATSTPDGVRVVGLEALVYMCLEPQALATPPGWPRLVSLDLGPVGMRRKSPSQGPSGGPTTVCRGLGN